MRIICVGTDIVHTPRIASLVARSTPIRLASRILSPSERRGWVSLSPPASYVPAFITERDLVAIMPEKWFTFLAVRWAINEAAYKALFPLYKLTRKDLTVSKMPGVENRARVKLHASVSHDGDYTVENPLAGG